MEQSSVSATYKPSLCPCSICMVGSELSKKHSWSGSMPVSHALCILATSKNTIPLIINLAAAISIAVPRLVVLYYFLPPSCSDQTPQFSSVGCSIWTKNWNVFSRGRWHLLQTLAGLLPYLHGPLAVQRLMVLPDEGFKNMAITCIMRSGTSISSSRLCWCIAALRPCEHFWWYLWQTLQNHRASS